VLADFFEVHKLFIQHMR